MAEVIYADFSTRSGVTQVVYVDKSVTIRGGYSPDFSEWDPDRYTTTLDADGHGRVFILQGNIPILEGLYITGGRVTGMRGVESTSSRMLPCYPALPDSG